MAACSAPSDQGRATLPTDSAAVETALSAGYEERARLGLGSPFRLIDLALHDPRLDSIARVRVARAILKRTLRGEGYEIDPVALDRVWIRFAGPQLGAGERHLRLIEETIRTARTPRAGEVLVRLGYGLAQMEWSLSGHAYSMVVHAASLVRDRELARRDALRLVAAARNSGKDPIRLIPDWRRGRRFEVEHPLAVPLPPGAQAWAAGEAPALLRRVRSLGLHLGGRTAVSGAASPHPAISPEQARLLTRVAEHTNGPPQPSVVIATHFAGKALLLADEMPWGGIRWADFRERAIDEERLVAEAALALARDPSLRTVTSVVLLRAAVALRAFSQEDPWFPGFGGPSSVELHQRYGISVSFAPEVPEPWKPYYMRALQEGLGDLKGLVPSLDLSDLKVHIPLSSSLEDVLASHDPGERVLSWPALTGSGALAHEIAHDLDWQMARRQKSRRGYASAVAAAARAEPFGRALRSLIPGPDELTPDLPPDRRAHAIHPPEVLARNFEWFVLMALAQRGRSNGHLSSALDGVLTGNGSLRPPGLEDGYGGAVVAALNALLPIPDSATERFRSAYWARRAPTPQEILRRFASIRPSERFQGELRLGVLAPGRSLSPLRNARAELIGRLDDGRCRARALPDPRFTTALHAWVAEAAEARARGLILQGARESDDNLALAWLLREFYGPLWPVPIVESAPPGLDLLAREVQLLGRSPRPVVAGFIPQITHSSCRGWAWVE